MSIEIQAGNLNQDGSVTIKLDGKDIKFVKESDLGAVKAQLKDRDGELTGFQSKLTELTAKYDEEHQSVLKERTAREQFEKQAQEGAIHVKKVEELTTKLAGLEKSSGDLSTRYAERLRNQLSSAYKIDAGKIKDQPLDELERIEKTLQLTGVHALPANYDGKGAGGGSGTGFEGKSPMQLATMAYADSDKK